MAYVYLKPECELEFYCRAISFSAQSLGRSAHKITLQFHLQGPGEVARWLEVHLLLF